MIKYNHWNKLFRIYLDKMNRFNKVCKNWRMDKYYSIEQILLMGNQDLYSQEMLRDI